MMSEEGWVLVGRIGRVIGLTGQLRLIPWTDHPERFHPGSRLFLRRSGAPPRPVTIADVMASGDGQALVVRFAAISTPEDARPLTGSDALIPADERLPPPPGSFYADELEGLTVLSPGGAPVGRVVALTQEVPSPYLTVRSEVWGEVLIPFRQVFVGEISREHRTLQLREPLEVHVPK